ncbi:YdcF family protein [Vagococcus fluvialis]|uniref:YdcF family protein n=1 Tax=Vagococcus fluvialis TaxID=2738 RepID=UPI0022DFF699|nr:YdcF family protein [Vagococcus fluvialis]
MIESATYINQLAKFCGKKELEELSQDNLKQHFNLEQVDILVLFGGSILQGGDCLAEAIQNKIAKNYIIVGGYGHTSVSLFEQMEKEIPGITKNISSEAELFAEYLKEKYQLTPDFLEVKSTNCGNNITNLLALIVENNLEMNSLLIMQDATMQLRMDATLRKYLLKEVPIINFPTYEVEVLAQNKKLVYDSLIPGMWEMERYVSLLMGEIPRLMDNLAGYGPKGKDFIAHVDIPEDVIKAYKALQEIFPELTREANPEFASK